MQDILEKTIRNHIEDYPLRHPVETRWREPLVGFANARDPLFDRLRTAVRASHALPPDLLAGARTVVVYFLPFEQTIARSNRKSVHASRNWAVAYVETNRLIIDINAHLAEVLLAEGFQAARMPPTHNFDTEQLMSDWSHKHAAYIAGLGRFGTHHLLITSKGCCGRFGSLVTDTPISPTPRPETEFCLDKAGGDCGICIEKCVTGALTEDGLDRHRCYGLLLENAEIFKEEGLADVCGKCTCMVPCSFKNPVRETGGRRTEDKGRRTDEDQAEGVGRKQKGQ